MWQFFNSPNPYVLKVRHRIVGVQLSDNGLTCGDELMATSEKGFLDYVQQHERTWGTDTYPGKPDLQEFLGADGGGVLATDRCRTEYQVAATLYRHAAQ